jgi:hypothetical protein
MTTRTFGVSPRHHLDYGSGMSGLGPVVSIGNSDIQLLYVAIIVACGWIAHRQGRSVGAWVALSFFLGPLALVLILVAGRPKAGQQKVSETPPIPA